MKKGQASIRIKGKKPLTGAIGICWLCKGSVMFGSEWRHVLGQGESRLAHRKGSCRRLYKPTPVPSQFDALV